MSQTSSGIRDRYYLFITGFYVSLIFVFSLIVRSVIIVWPRFPNLIPQVAIPHPLKFWLTALSIAFTVIELYTWIFGKIFSYLHDFWFSKQVLRPEEYQKILYRARISEWTILITGIVTIVLALI